MLFSPSFGVEIDTCRIAGDCCFCQIAKFLTINTMIMLILNKPSVFRFRANYRALHSMSVDSVAKGSMPKVTFGMALKGTEKRVGGEEVILCNDLFSTCNDPFHPSPGS